MEEDLVPPKIDRNAYIKARLIEVIDDLDVAVNLWLSGRTRNAAGKVFGSVKALLSALVTKELDKPGRVNQSKRGYTVPTHSVKGVATDLMNLGYTQILLVAELAMDLHDYQYNGFDPDFSRYRTRERVLHDVLYVAEAILSSLKTWFSEYWDEKLETLYRIALSDLEKLKGRAN